MDKCPWALTHPLLEKYHDEVWGKPVYDENKLYEMLVLESFQAGLSWLTILKRYDGFKAAFCDFEWQKVARFTADDVTRLLQNETIIRHRGKIEATINNAQVLQKLANSQVSLYDLLWDEVGHQQILNHWQFSEEVPSQDAIAQRLAKKLKKLGFKFVGPTTCYSLMQACGLVNDHLESCPSWKKCQEVDFGDGSVSY
ncbi:DNA-3-methyladenine glycosylase I [Ligilactobacillus equi]|nr:DNA-3-methyladenine glycosylase I [Ligilactobacillus equi]